MENKNDTEAIKLKDTDIKIDKNANRSRKKQKYFVILGSHTPVGSGGIGYNPVAIFTNLNRDFLQKGFQTLKLNLSDTVKPLCTRNKYCLCFYRK